MDNNSIKELRSRTGLSQSGFANYFGIPVRTLQEWEQGRKKPRNYWVALMQRVWELESEELRKKEA